jgi:hypothetical protein
VTLRLKGGANYDLVIKTFPRWLKSFFHLCIRRLFARSNDACIFDKQSESMGLRRTAKLLVAVRAPAAGRRPL